MIFAINLGNGSYSGGGTVSSSYASYPLSIIFTHSKDIITAMDIRNTGGPDTGRSISMIYRIL